MLRGAVRWCAIIRFGTRFCGAMFGVPDEIEYNCGAG